MMGRLFAAVDRRPTPLTMVQPMPDFFAALAAGVKHRGFAWLLRSAKHPCARPSWCCMPRMACHNGCLTLGVAAFSVHAHSWHQSMAAAQVDSTGIGVGDESQGGHSGIGTHDDGSDAHVGRRRGQRPAANRRRHLQCSSPAWCPLFALPASRPDVGNPVSLATLSLTSLLSDMLLIETCREALPSLAQGKVPIL